MVALFVLTVVLIASYVALLAIKCFHKSRVESLQSVNVEKNFCGTLMPETEEEIGNLLWRRTAYVLTFLFIVCTLPHFIIAFTKEHESLHNFTITLAISRSYLSPIALLVVNPNVRAFARKLKCQSN